MNQQYHPLKNGILLLKNVYMPLVKKYLERAITSLEFEELYIKAFHDFKGGGFNIPEDLALSISTVFMDVDEYWSWFDPNDPDHVEQLEKAKNYTILEPELYRRCTASYQEMLAMLKKYAEYSID
jgi:hypothetical protein